MSADRVHIRLLSHLLVLSALLLIIPLRLFPCFFSGFLVHETIVALGSQLERLVDEHRARRLAGLLVIATLTGSLVLGLTSIIPRFLELAADGRRIDAEIGRLLLSVRCRAPRPLRALVPESTEELLCCLSSSTTPGVTLVGIFGRDLLHLLANIATGIVIGALISLDRDRPAGSHLAEQLLGRLHHLSRAFRDTVLAQLKVSVVSSCLTAVLLLLIFPLFDISIPLRKTLVLVTFATGLLPVIGNLISSLTISAAVLPSSLLGSLAAALYLFLVHKFGYFLNAELVRCRIDARPWELLTAMLVFDAVFGLQGVIAAPIYYAYLKSELRSCELS